MTALRHPGSVSEKGSLVALVRIRNPCSRRAERIF